MIGVVDDVEHRRNGSLLITTKTLDQLKNLLKQTRLPVSQTPIKASIAWSTQTVCGKIFAPEFEEDTLETILTQLKPEGVIQVRKMLQDPRRADSQLYILTFLGDKCPDKVTVGYSKYAVDKYHPTPSICTKCFRWNHSKKYCHDVQHCSICGSKEHSRDNCTANSPLCRNCQGQHAATSKKYPAYIQEMDICKYRSEHHVSKAEARLAMSQIIDSTHTVSNQVNFNAYNTDSLSQHRFKQQQVPDLRSKKDFPQFRHTEYTKQQTPKTLLTRTQYTPYSNRVKENNNTHRLLFSNRYSALDTEETQNTYIPETQQEDSQESYIQPRQRTPTHTPAHMCSYEPEHNELSLTQLLASQPQHVTYTQMTQPNTIQHAENNHINSSENTPSYSLYAITRQQSCKHSHYF